MPCLVKDGLRYCSLGLEAAALCAGGAWKGLIYCLTESGESGDCSSDEEYPEVYPEDVEDEVEDKNFLGFFEQRQALAGPKMRRVSVVLNVDLAIIGWGCL